MYLVSKNFLKGEDSEKKSFGQKIKVMRKTKSFLNLPHSINYL